MRLIHAAIILIGASALAFGQLPVIGSVQNAAALSGVVIASQMLVMIKGQNLASTSATAAFPWQKQLAGASVTFNGIPAALYYASSSQINALVPSALQGATTAMVVVTTAAGPSAAMLATVRPSAIRIFTQDMSGCGQLAAYNIHADGSLGLNTPQNSLDPINDYGLSIWLTGLGAFPDRVDGVPWQYNPSDNLVKNPPSLILGIPNIPAVSSLLEPMVVTYAGPAPGLSGVDQVNATFPNVPPTGRGQVRHQGCNVPLYLTDSVSSASQMVSVSIHDGGGACVDPASSGLATFIWQKGSSNDDRVLATDSIIATFYQGPEINFVDAGLTSEFQYSTNLAPQPSVCAASYPKTLDVGAVTARGPDGIPQGLRAANLFGILSYAGGWPGGEIAGGSYQVSGNGFADGEPIPGPIKITTSLQSGAKVPSALTVNWTGGTARSVVTVQMLVRAPAGTPPLFVASQTVPGTAGAVSFPGSTQQSPYPTGNVEVMVTQQRAAGATTPFAIPGFSMGGEQTWRYFWDFQNLSNE